MLQISKKFIICLTSILISVTCASCKTDAPYLIKDYLNYLAINSGIGNSEIIETNFEDLLVWEVVEENDVERLNDSLDYQYLNKTLNVLIDDNNSNRSLIDLGILDDDANEKRLVSKQEAEEIVDKVIDVINNKTFESKYEYEINSDDSIYYDEDDCSYKIIGDSEIRDAQFDEVFSSFDISDSYVVDFSNAEVIPYQDEVDDVGYVNNKYTLLASKNHVFNKDGFRISYSLNRAGISIHVSKDVNDMNIFADLDIRNVKPNFKWTYEDNDFKNCYFNISFDTTEEFGISDGRYSKYYLKFKDLDSSSFSKMIKSMLLKEKNSSDAIIPICQIKTPFASIPSAYLNFDVLLKFSINGKIELVLYNNHNFGFEIKEGKSRFFYEHDDDFDGIARASGKACVGLNIGIDAATYRLCDIELDGGLKAEMKSTMHMYDSDGNMTSESINAPYSALEEMSKENPNLLICGDLSFYWVFDVILNTYRSVLYKMGFSKTINVLDEDNQVFGNLHHIENGQFVEKCTRKSKPNINNNTIDVTAYDKITLNSYAEVLIKGETFKVEIKGLPKGYTEEDIRYLSLNENVASIDKGIIYGKDYGNAKMKIYTKDNKYNTYINVLVSTG